MAFIVLAFCSDATDGPDKILTLIRDLDPFIMLTGIREWANVRVECLSPWQQALPQSIGSRRWGLGSLDLGLLGKKDTDSGFLFIRGDTTGDIRTFNTGGLLLVLLDREWRINESISEMIWVLFFFRYLSVELNHKAPTQATKWFIPSDKIALLTLGSQTMVPSPKILWFY